MINKKKRTWIDVERHRCVCASVLRSQSYRDRDREWMNSMKINDLPFMASNKNLFYFAFFSSIHIENSLVHSQLAIFSINYNQKTRICVTDQRNWCRVCIASEKQSKKRTKKRRKNNNNNNNVFWKWIRDYLQTERQALYIHTLDGYTSTKTHTLCLLHFMFCYYFLCLRWTWAAVASFANDSECIYILMVMLYVVYMPHNSRISVRSRPPQPFPRSNDFRECLCTRNGTGDERERETEKECMWKL